MNITNLLDLTIKNHASDLHLSTGLAPIVRVDGDICQLDLPPLKQQEILSCFNHIMNQQQRQQFKHHQETDFSITHRDHSRFRVNAFYQQRGVAAVFRHIPAHIVALDRLALDQTLHDLCDIQHGLILVTGATGSGKSTTLAALVEQINITRNAHIITIEDPIEFIFRSKKCLIHQRELHCHTESFTTALRAALREDPDIIYIGELRDLETIRLALSAAETGHLVLATLHSPSAPQSIDRIIDVFPASEKDMIRTLLAESLQAVIAQRLLKKNSGGRIAAYEVMRGSHAIRNLIREHKTAQLYSSIQSSASLAMFTCDQYLKKLIQHGLISTKTARTAAKYPDAF